MPASPSVVDEVLSPGATPSSTEKLPGLAYRSTLSPEAEFVVLGARTRLEGARLQRWEKLLLGQWKRGPAAKDSPALDWEVVLGLASSHRVLGLLGRHLSARSWQDVPAPVKAAIQNFLMRTTTHSSALKAELGRVSHLLEAAGVPVVSFKGPTLGVMAYGNSVVRPSADLDLLVARGDVRRTRDLLVEAGYLPEVALSSSQEEIALRVDSVLNFHCPAPPSMREILPQGYAVELHWAITSPCLPFDLDYATVAPNLDWIELPGVPTDEFSTACVRALAPEDLLLILCVHGAKHLWERLIWLCDLAELVGATPDLDWERALEMAQARGVRRMTALGLALMRDVLGTPLPRAVENWLTTQPEALRLSSRLRRQLLAPTSDPSQLAGHLVSADALLMQTIDNRRHRVGFVWHLATMPTLGERAALDLPPHLNFLWPILRPARALQKRLRRPARD